MSVEIVSARPMSVPGQQESQSLLRIAADIANAGLYRKTAKNPQEVFVLLLAARDMGVAPTTALAGGIHMVDGKPEVSANLQAQLLREYRGPEGQRYRHRILTPPEKRSEECRIEFSIREPGEGWEAVGEELFTMADAQRAGLAGKGVWKSYPKMMLLARCLSDGIASHCPETARGLRVYGEGEIGGPDPEPEVSPTTMPPEGQVFTTSSTEHTKPAEPEPEVVDAEVVRPDRGEDAVATMIREEVDAGRLEKRGVMLYLTSEGASDTSSLEAALRSLTDMALQDAVEHFGSPSPKQVPA
jgi:hypothetical protein